MRRSETIAMLRSPRAFAGAIFVNQGASPRVDVASPSGLATLTRSRAAAAIGVVGLHDRLHEFVTHHVAFVEVDEPDAVDLADDVDRLHQAGSAAGQIDLRD